MKKYLITSDYDYVMGYLKNAHLQGIIEAESLEEAKEKAINFSDWELVIDDYGIGDNPIEMQEMEYE